MKFKAFFGLLFANFLVFGQSVDMTILTGTSIVVEPDTKLFIGGGLSNAGQIELKASSSNYAQLKVSGVVSGAGTVSQSQYLENGSHLIASSVASGFSTTSGDNSKLFPFDALNGNWATMGSALSTVGVGFAARVSASQIPFLLSSGNFSVTGVPNTSANWTISNSSLATTTGSGSGWNLLGNPYTCGLDFSGVYSANSNLLSNAFYVWDASLNSGQGGYQYYSGGGISSSVIPPLQGFWVQALPTQTGSVSTTMASDGTLSSSPIFYKGLPDNLELKFTRISDTSIFDRLWISNIQGSNLNYDPAFDAWKMSNGPTVPMAYTEFSGERFAINAFDFVQYASIPVGFSENLIGTKYLVTLKQRVSDREYLVYLEDRFFNLLHDFTKGSYSFTHVSWTQEEPRFVLHFFDSFGLESDDHIATSSFKAYQSGPNIILQHQGCGFYRLLSSNGQLLSSGQLLDGVQLIQAPDASGVYIIHLDCDAHYEFQKIYIQK